MNGNETHKQLNKINEEKNAKQDASNKSSPCVWKFYQDKKNDDFYRIGYRVQMTLQKVSF
jgi:hypothetical protein